MQRGLRRNEDKIFEKEMKNNEEEFPFISVKCRIRTVYYDLVIMIITSIINDDSSYHHHCNAGGMLTQRCGGEYNQFRSWSSDNKGTASNQFRFKSQHFIIGNMTTNTKNNKYKCNTYKYKYKFWRYTILIHISNK